MAGGDPDPDFLIHFVPQNLGLVMALAIPMRKCEKTSYDGSEKWHYNPADIIANESRLGFDGAYKAIVMAIREYMAWVAMTPIPPPKPKPANIGAPIWHM